MHSHYTNVHLLTYSQSLQWASHTSYIAVCAAVSGKVFHHLTGNKRQALNQSMKY